MKGVWKSGLFKIGLACTVVAVLILGVALPAMAATPTATTTAARIQEAIINGKVSVIAADSKSFTVQPETGDAVMVKVDANTKYYKTSGTPGALTQLQTDVAKRLPTQTKTPETGKPTVLPNERGSAEKTSAQFSQVRPADVSARIAEASKSNIKPEQMPEMKAALDLNAEQQANFWGKITSFFNRSPAIGKAATFADIAVGDAVVVKVMPKENLAKQVMIIKPDLTIAARGTITAVAADSFTLTTTATPYQTLVLKWDANTRVNIKGAVALEKGQVATVMYNSATLVASNVDAQIPAPAPTVTATPTPTTTIN
jgi:hypothetical protein